MTTDSVEYITSWYQRLFPERQIYHRCNGQVHFTTVSGRTQVIGVVISLFVLGWVAYATVNVMFTDQISLRMEASTRDTNRRWEAELAAILGDYERLQAGVSVVREELEVTLQQLEERQNEVDAVLEERSSLLLPRIERMEAAESSIFSPPEGGANTSVSLLNTMDPDPTPRRSRPVTMAVRSPIEGLSNIIEQVSPRAEKVRQMESQITVIRDLERRIATIQTKQYAKLATLEEQTNERIAEFQTALTSTGVDYTELFTTHSASLAADDMNGQGGPFVSATADDLASDAFEGHLFSRKASRITRQLQKLAALKDTFSVLPVTRPVDSYRITSPFGPRVDPFSGRFALHRGVDIGGRRGTPIVATAPGVVAKALRTSGFGNMVEIRHADGLVTIYGHMDTSKVKAGQTVKRGDIIGTLGSTGRSTAPHLHYEIKYGKKAVDPMKFFEAGRYVFENQG